MNPAATIVLSALAIGLGGVAWRISRWFTLRIGPEHRERPGVSLVAQALGAVGRSMSSRRLAGLFKSIVWEVLLQGHVFRQDWRRGAVHLALCYGMLYLVIFHALDDFTSTALWGEYAPTLNPWRFVRNLCGLLILAAAAIAVRRRRSAPLLRRTRSSADRLAIALLAAMVLSGIVLESRQITSPAVFDAMVDDYLFDAEPDEIEALRTYWQVELGGAGPIRPRIEADARQYGKELHTGFCAACHDHPRSAFLSYPLAKLWKPLDGIRRGPGSDTALWYVHFITACLGLALLPFTKFFHLVATPVSLLVRSTGSAAASPAELRPVRRALGLDACTHCGVCNQHCAVAIVYRVNANPAILPSEKLAALRHGVSALTLGQSAALAEGSFICTACGRCTAWCPSGIDLQDLWQASRDDLARQGLAPLAGPDPIRKADPPPAPLAPLADEVRPFTLGAPQPPETFWACVQCTICTSVCPVVAVSDNPHLDLDLTPQQIMNMLRLQLRELALDARMVWDCVTCYQCQEHCPQGIRVTDILHELRHESHRRRQAAACASSAADDHCAERMP
ncbi:MAG: 4Fe-4S dicluster domain-containing protein [Desulfobacterales bacterium]|nr:4Fe-4S dicluster domain-containing protein [Desulfobacterales bacterium]